MEHTNILRLKSYTCNVLDIAEDGTNYVLSFLNGEYLKVNEVSKKVIEKFDGTKDYKEIAETLKAEGIHVTEEMLKSFADEYLSKNCLFENDSLNKPEYLENSSRLWFHLPLIKGEKLTSILSKFSFLFRKDVTITVLTSFALLQLILYFFGYFNSLMNINIFKLNGGAVLLITVLSFIFHELGHAVSAHYYKIKVGDLGVGIYLFRPVLYTDLSNAWTLDRKKRVVTNLGGVYFQVVFALVLSIFIFVFPSITLSASIILIMISIVLNLNPILRLDGYWVLTDAIGIVNINDRAFSFFKQIILRLFKKNYKIKDSSNIKRNYKIVYYSYITIYFVSTVVAVIFGILLVIKLFVYNTQLVNAFCTFLDNIKAYRFLDALHSFNSLIIIVLPGIYFTIMLIYGLSKFFRKLSFKKSKQAKA